MSKWSVSEINRDLWNKEHGVRHWPSPRGQGLPPCNGCSGLPRLQAGVVCLINRNPLSTHTETRCPMQTVPREALCSLAVQGSFLIISCFSPTNISHRLPISLPCSGEFVAIISLSFWSFLPSSEILTMWELICLMGAFFPFCSANWNISGDLFSALWSFLLLGL